jgi:hypothetical protein
LPSTTLTETQSWAGTLSKVIVEGNGPNSGAHYFLRAKEGKQSLELTFETPPPFVTGTELTVEGFERETRFHVTRYSPLERNLKPVGKAVQPLIDAPVQKTRTVGVIAVDANEGGTNASNELLRQLVLDADNPGPTLGLGPKDKSARQYYSEVSYGTYRIRGAVEGPVAWNGSACAGGVDDAAYQLRDELSATYDSYVWYFGSIDEDCGYAWGEEGTWSSPAQNTWFNGRFDANVFSHEMGHNIGLMHASTLACDGTPFSDEPLSCTSDEYGSRYSVMGTGGIGHLNAVEKWYLTWFGGCNGVHVRQSGTWTLLPLELSCNGIQALQIPMPKMTRTFSTAQSEEPTEAKYYYLELRTNRRLDTGTTTQVLVHVSDDISPITEVSARTALLDMDPTTPAFDGLHAGDSYTDPSGGLSFRIDSLSDEKAMVTVTMTENDDTTTCMDGGVLIGPGPDSCEEPFIATGVDGAYGNHINELPNGDLNKNAANGYGGASAANDTTLGGDAANSIGGQKSTQGSTVASLQFGDPENCSCRIGGPKPNVSSAFGWASLTALLLLVGQRRQGHHYRTLKLPQQGCRGRSDD